MSKDRIIDPRADMLMGSMRSMGYSFESAVADIIDNSISAKATKVKILFPTSPTDIMAVGILDNGCGMSKEALVEAMRYGSRPSEEKRDEYDLGRFGLGLKSASLSQCKVLTVVSWSNGSVSAYSWDYDYILEKKKWLAKELLQKEIKDLPYFEELESQKSGTLIIWQNFDTFYKSEGQVYGPLNDLKDRLNDSLGLIFHRYIRQSKNKINIFINNYKIKAMDPFLERHPKTTTKKERTIAIRDTSGIERLINIKPYVLPFATDLTEEDKKLIGGIENLRLKQGFYIYRNNRLIIWGTWFGMKPRAELTKNARIRVDIPNTLDDIWSIDIKKQSATIPKRIQQQLKNTVIQALEISINKQIHRGRKEKNDDTKDYIWERYKDRTQSYYYLINRDSQLFKYIRSKMSDQDFTLLQIFLNEIEKNLPIQQIYVDKSNERLVIEDQIDRFEDVYQLGVTMVSNIHSFNNRPYDEIISELMNSEPFCNYQDLKEKLKENFINETH